MNITANYTINIGNNATIWNASTGSNTTMQWIYNWEFDLSMYNKSQALNTTISIPAGQSVALIGVNNSTRNVTLNST
jgi:transcription elongation GreA/GreB family factor